MTKTLVDKNLKTFGENLRKCRVKAKLSLRALAASCNIDHSDIAKMEKGEINITLLTLIELSKGLDIQPKKLMDLDFDLDN